MENLNAEQVKKALGCCHSCNEADCKDCGYRHKADGEEDLYISCVNVLISDALALINKQETEYNEIYELLQTCKADSEAYRSYSKTLEKENEGLKNLLDESFEAQNTVKADTVRKMQEMVYEFADDLNTIDAYIIKEMIDQIAKEMLEDAE